MLFPKTVEDWKAGKRTWRETTAEAYEYALCVLPPDSGSCPIFPTDRKSEENSVEDYPGFLVFMRNKRAVSRKTAIII
ncbi:MAG: hypothetical protein LBV12_04325 [Puniceicoccales bacterium]|nr:hypothetical protein [Puniceicoccales bacterium]